MKQNWMIRAEGGTLIEMFLTKNVIAIGWKKIGDLSKFTLGLPTIAEQKRISQIITDFNNKSELIIKRKKTLERIKQGLMDDLLTGKKRVKI